MKPLNQVNWGVIGCGNVCERKSAPAMNKIPHSKLVAVMRRNETKVKDYANRHQVPKWYTDASDLIQDPDVNAIYIATPPHLHKKYTLEAAAMGKPVYVEKPMARTYQECLDMIEACEEAKVPLFVAYYRRRLPHLQQVKSWIDRGLIGVIRSVSIELFQSPKPTVVDASQSNWRVQPEFSGGGYFFDLASHQLDYLDYLFGPISKATGLIRNQANLYEAEDVVSATFEFETGIMGSGMWCFTVSEKAQKEEMVIRGSKGWIRFHAFSSSQIQIESDQLIETLDFEMPFHIQQPLIETIVQELLGVGTCPSHGDAAARTNWVMDQITKG